MDSCTLKQKGAGGCSLIDGVDLGHEGVVLGAVFIIVVDLAALLNNLHRLFVNALEQKNCEGSTSVAEEEEHPDAVGLLNVTLEDDGEHEAEGGGWVVRRAGHHDGGLAVADHSCVCCRDDQGRDGRVRGHLCLLFRLSQIEEGDEHGADRLHNHALDDKEIVIGVTANCERLVSGVPGLEQVVGEDSADESTGVLGSDVEQAEDAREAAGISAEHEGERDGRVEVRTGDAGAEDQQDEEAAKKTGQVSNSVARVEQ